MKATILLAGFFAVGVIAVFVGLILSAGKSLAGKGEGNGDGVPTATRFVPTHERIMQDREQEKAKKEAFHTKAEPPKVRIFQTSYKEGTQVTFNHAKHVDQHKCKCIDCHHVERCSKCHLRSSSSTMEVVKGKQALHENCIGCHAESGGPEDCAGCHKQ